MKITILSDLNWLVHMRSISMAEVTGMNADRLLMDRYERIKRYLDIIIKEKSELVLFAGDITGDGSCGHGYQNAFKILLSQLESLGIPSIFISGNHDPVEFYDDLLTYTDKLQLCQEISNQKIVINGVRVLGINYDCSASKSRLTQLIEKHQGDSFDIVLAHSQLKRRIRLFDLNTKFIITGHYDRKLLHFNGSTFISLDNDWSEVSYATIDIGEQTQASIKIKQDPRTTLSYAESYPPSSERNHMMFVNDTPAINLDEIESYEDRALQDDSGESMLYLKYLRGRAYQAALHSLWHQKHKPENSIDRLSTDEVFQLQITANYKISKRLIKDYLG